MHAPSAHEIKEKLSDYLADRLPFDAFEDWFVPATLQIEGSADREAERLTWAIMTPLTAFTSGDLDEEDFKRQMAGILAEPAGTTESPAIGSRHTK